MISLTAAEEKIRSQIEKNNISYRYVGNVAKNNDRDEFLNWLKKHGLFDRHVFVLMGVHNSNKRSLLQEELPQYYIQKMNPYGFALCYDLIEKDPDLNDILKIAPTFQDRLSIYSWAISQLERFPYSPAAILQYTNKEELFGLKQNRYRFYERLALPKMGFLTGIVERNGDKYDYKSVNLGALLILLNSISILIESDIEDVGDFGKFLILSGFSQGNPISKEKLDASFSKWAQLEESIIGRYRNQTFPIKISRFKSRNYSPLFEMSDSELIQNCADSNFYDAVITFRILQLRFHYNRGLDLSYEEMSKFSLLKDYINELAFLGIIERGKYSEIFKWPKIGKVSNFSYSTFNRFDENKPETLLRKTGYRVGKSGLPVEKRQTLLSDFYEGNSKVEKEAINYWSRPNGAERLEKLAKHLVRQIRNHRKIGNEKAVSDWREDLVYLKDKFYDARGYKFNYPKVRSI